MTTYCTIKIGKDSEQFDMDNDEDWNEARRFIRTLTIEYNKPAIITPMWWVNAFRSWAIHFARWSLGFDKRCAERGCMVRSDENHRFTCGACRKSFCEKHTKAICPACGYYMADDPV